MKILLTGGTGFVGKRLSLELLKQGHQLIFLTRNKEAAQKKLLFPCEIYEWDWQKGTPPAEAIQGVEGVVHLMGENIAAKRWSQKQKARIYDSRVKSTEHLKQVLQATTLKFFISASAVGIYAKNTGEALTEDSPRTQGFLADVCHDWEQAGKGIQTKRHIIFRIGVILGEESGALAKLLPLFRLGAGGPVGGGQQKMSWIHVDDLVHMITTAVNDESVNGTYNAVAPETITNKEFTKILGKAVQMPAFAPAPGFALKLAMGEMSGIILDSQHVLPQKWLDEQRSFAYPELQSALSHIVPQAQLPKQSKTKACHRFHNYQLINQPLDKVFEFFSDPRNLEKLTPPWLNFKIISCTDEKTKVGTLINYKLKVRGFPISWTTEIKDFQEQDYFRDFQLKGPYAIWDHTHTFIHHSNGTLMTDEVLYRLPLGPIGALTELLVVRKDIEKIFNYRGLIIDQLF